MPELKLQISASPDGYVAGPSQSEEHPPGKGPDAVYLEYRARRRAAG